MILYVKFLFPPGDSPQITKIDTDPLGKQNIETGGTMKICCYATGEQPLKYSWWFSSEAPDDSSSMVLPDENGSTLDIKDAKEQDHQGFYCCRVSNRFGGPVNSSYLTIKVGEFQI